MPQAQTPETPCDIDNVLINHAGLIDNSLVNAAIPSNGVLRLVRSDDSTFDVNIPYFLDGVVSGLEFSLEVPPNADELDYTAGTYQINAQVYNIVSNGTINLTVGDTTNPRVDIVTLTTTNTLNYIVGTPAASPTRPAIPVGEILAVIIGVAVNADNTGGYTLTEVNIIGEDTPTLPIGAAQGDTIYFDASLGVWVFGPTYNAPGEASLFNVGGAIKVDDYVDTLSAGIIRWDGFNFQGYDGTNWINLDQSGVTPGTIDGTFLTNSGGSWVENTSLRWNALGIITGDHQDLSFSLLQPASMTPVTLDVRYQAGEDGASGSTFYSLDINDTVDNYSYNYRVGSTDSFAPISRGYYSTFVNTEFFATETFEFSNVSATYAQQIFDVSNGSIAVNTMQVNIPGGANYTSRTYDSVALEWQNLLTHDINGFRINSVFNDSMTVDWASEIEFTDTTTRLVGTNSGATAIGEITIDASGIIIQHTDDITIDADRTLFNSGAIGYTNFRQISVDSALTNSDYLVYVTGNTITTLELPQTPFGGMQITIKKTDAASFSYDIDGNGNNIEGAATYAHTGSRTFVTVHFDGSDWWIIS